MEKKNIYFYIDEAGTLNINGEKFFLFCCILTNNPSDLLNCIEKFEITMNKKAYYRRYEDSMDKLGIHATSNHPDVYALFIQNLISMDFRSYILLVDKKSPEFANFKNDQSNSEVYDRLIKILLKDRMLKNHESFLHFVFEQNLPNPTPNKLLNRKKYLEEMLRKYANSLFKNKIPNKPLLQFDVKVLTKEEDLRLAISDYIAHIVGKFFDKENTDFQIRYKHNFHLLEGKVAVIHDLLAKKYIKLRDYVEFDV